MSRDSGYGFGYFVAGMGIGAVLALLFAPRTGEETRELLAQKADKGKDYARRQSKVLRKEAEGYVGKGKETLAKQKEQLSSALEAGKVAYEREKTKTN